MESTKGNELSVRTTTATFTAEADSTGSYSSGPAAPFCNRQLTAPCLCGLELILAKDSVLVRTCRLEVDMPRLGSKELSVTCSPPLLQQQPKVYL